MARGRMLDKSLSTSRRFALARERGGRLGEFCQLLYPLLNAHTDDFGRLAGDAFTVKALVLPTSPRRESEFEAALVALSEVGLICRAEVAGQWVIQVVGFDHHQPGLHKRTKSHYPEISNEISTHTETPGTSGKFPEIPSEENRTELKRTEEKRTEPKAPARLSEDGFDEFWRAYPKKVAKGAALKAWRGLKPDAELRQLMLDAIIVQRQSRDWLKDNGQFVPNPASWLNQQRWLDDLTPLAHPRSEPAAVGSGTCPHDPPCARTADCVARTINDSRAVRGEPALASGKGL